MASRISTNQRDQSKGSPTSKPSESSNRSTNQSIQRNNTQPSQSSYQRQSDQSIHSPYYITSDQLTLSPGFQSQSFNQPSNRYPSSSSNALTSLDINQALPHSVPVSGSVSSSCRLHLDANDPMTDRQNIQHPLQTNQQPTNQSNNQRIPQQQHEPLPELDWHGDIDTTDESDYEDEDLEQEDDDDYGSEDDSPRSGRVLTFADEHGDNLCHVLTYDPQAYHQNPATTDTSQISSKSSINLDSVEDANLQAQLHAQKIAREREKRTLRNDAEAACQCSIQ